MILALSTIPAASIGTSNTRRRGREVRNTKAMTKPASAIRSSRNELGYNLIFVLVLLQTTCAFQVASPLVAARRNTNRASAASISRETAQRALTSEYRDEVRDEEYYYNDDPYFNNNISRGTFSVAGQQIPGHQILTSSNYGNNGARNIRYAGSSFDDYSDPGDVRFSETGNGMMQGNQVVRASDPNRGPTRRGDHMRVTTSNPTFLRTDNPNNRRRSPYASYGDEYDDFNGDSRFFNNNNNNMGGFGNNGRSSFAPNSQDLVGFKRQSMKSDDIGNWNGDVDGEDMASRRRRNSSSSSFRRNSNNNRRKYGFSQSSRNRNNLDFYLPHFLTEQEGFPIPLDVEDENDYDQRRRGRMGGGGGMFPYKHNPFGKDNPFRSRRDREQRRRGNYSDSRREDSDVLGYRAYKDDEAEEYARRSRQNSKSSRNSRYNSFERSMSNRYRRDRYYDDDDWEASRQERQSYGNWSPQDIVGRQDYYGDDDEWPTPLRLTSSRSGPQRRRWERQDDYAAPQDVFGRRHSDEWQRGTATMRRPRSNQRRYYANEEDDMWEGGGPVSGPLPQDLFGVDSRYVSAQQGWSTGTSNDVVV